MAATLLANSGLSIAELAEKLDRTGFVCLADVVSPDWLTEARDNITANLAKYGQNDFCILRPDHEQHTPAHDFISDPAVHSIMDGLATARCPHGVSANEEIYSVLRVLAGPERAASFFAFHYDAAVVTMLVPLIMPTAGAGRSGELVVLPNRRPFRRSVTMNMLEKVSMQNRFYRKRILREIDCAPGKYTVEMKRETSTCSGDTGHTTVTCAARRTPFGQRCFCTMETRTDTVPRSPRYGDSDGWWHRRLNTPRRPL